ncbi:MAG TPA: hypothetical protein VFN56_03675 [Candidatus Saccharimonadales bacterium]|nr:hypothetical protein [Candidatus Saccharimonadales bacterium]
MKRSSWFVLGFVFFLAATSVAVYYAGIGFFNRYTRSVDTQPAAIQCLHKGMSHIVVFEHNAVHPTHTVAQLCDTLTITNLDNTLRLIAFGPHEHHEQYDGVTEQVLDKGNSLTVTLNQAGNYTFHDHLNDSLVGSFSVR